MTVIKNLGRHTNSQVERTNDMILQGLKPGIFDRLNKSGQ
jgi:hypothetical protein